MDIPIAFPFLAAAVGFIVAVPFGPVNLEIIRRVLNHETKPAIIFGMGAATADGLWPLIGFIGIAPFLEINWVAALFWAIATTLIAYLGISAIRQGRDIPHKENVIKKDMRRRVSFLMGFSLVLSNPMNLVVWITTLGVFHKEGLLPAPSLFSALLLWFSVMAGATSLFALVIFIVRRYKHFITDTPIEKRINMIFGPILLAISLYFAYNLYQAILRLV
jgi:threonine/homoserine/homoserine lactone efflux protein